MSTVSAGLFNNGLVMKKIKSNQGARERAVTAVFVKAIRKLQSLIIKEEGACFAVHGSFHFSFDEGVSYELYHEGDLVARWDCRRGKQYGATSQIEAAIKELMPDNSAELGTKALKMLKSSTTMLNNALMIVKESNPSAGISLTSNDLLVLRDIRLPETTENTLYKVPLAGTVRSIL
jgi:hypothetical protein